jgi:AAA15 family ATPase/GTPase
MIHSFHIKNYRGFKDFAIEPLERVNLITGSNNVGKTSLLEALYLNLTTGTAFYSNWDSNEKESSTRHNLFRGFKDLGFNLDNVSKWGWLFYGKNLSKDIELKSVGENDETQIQKMYWLLEDKSGAVPIPEDFPTDELSSIFLHVNFKNFYGKEVSWRINKSGPIDLPASSRVLDSVPLRLLFNISSRSQEEDTKWFSKLDDVGRQDEVISILQLVEPRLKSLAVSTSDGPPMIYGDIGIGRRVPMSQMGEGMVRLLSLVLEITNASGGVVLVDEIENGLHYSVMNSVWKAIAAAAHQSNTQIFATTHSFECIRAAHEAFLSRGEYDFRLHRLDRIKDEIRSVTYNADMLSAAIVSDFEVR